MPLLHGQQGSDGVRHGGPTKKVALHEVTADLLQGPQLEIVLDALRHNAQGGRGGASSGRREGDPPCSGRKDSVTGPASWMGAKAGSLGSYDQDRRSRGSRPPPSMNRTRWGRASPQRQKTKFRSSSVVPAQSSADTNARSSPSLVSDVRGKGGCHDLPLRRI